MPKVPNATYQDLYHRQHNLLQFARDYWALTSICKPIRDSVMKYEKWNAIPLTYLKNKEQELLAAHVEVDEKGNFLFEGENEGLKIAGQTPFKTVYRGQMNTIPVFKSAADAVAFNDAWIKLMNTPCEITI